MEVANHSYINVSVDMSVILWVHYNTIMQSSLVPCYEACRFTAFHYVPRSL